MINPTAQDNLMPRTFAAIASGTFYYLSSSLFLASVTPLAAVRTGTRSGSPQWRSREYCYCVLQAFKQNLESARRHRAPIREVQLLLTRTQLY